MRKLRPDMSVRLVVHSFPQSREVFRRYGEEEDRPVFGHLEPLHRFARRHDVDLDRLLADLAAATGAEIDWNAARDERLHRPFILIALFVTLTLGAGWGGYLLARMGPERSFDAVSAADVIAHGAAQLWGFVVIFVLGVAMRYLPATTGRRAPPAAVRGWALGSLLVGVVGGFLWSATPHRLSALGAVSGIALLSGSTTYFAVAAHSTRKRLGQVWVRHVLVAAAWLVVWAGWTLYLQSGASAEGPVAFRESERQIVMDLALFGFALGSVYGFGRNLLPGFLGTGKPPRALPEAAFWLHNTGVLLLLAGRALSVSTLRVDPSRIARANGLSAPPDPYRDLGMSGLTPFVDPLLIAGMTGLALGAVVYVMSLKWLRGRRISMGPEKGHPFVRRYIQLAFLWLVVSLLSFDAIAIAEAAGVDVPHAIHGAVRHAFTVGFLVTLMVGMGQRLLPILGHTLLAWPRLVVPTFALIATGNFLRVASETATVWWPYAFLVMPFSAVLELAALSLFAANAIRTMWPAPDPLIRTGRVTANSRLATLLAEHPWIEDELIAWGYRYIVDARQVPMELTVGSFATSSGLDLDETLARINETLRDHTQPPRSVKWKSANSSTAAERVEPS